MRKHCNQLSDGKIKDNIAIIRSALSPKDIKAFGWRGGSYEVATGT